MLIRHIVIEYRMSHPGCGMHKMYEHLRPISIGRDKFVKLMKSWDLDIKKRSRPCITTIPGSIRFPNYIEGLLVSDINQVWQTDITYIRIGLCHYYLIFIIDVYSQKVVSYQVSETMHAIHNLKCLRRALKARRITKENQLIHHSDRGAQFTSLEYLDELNKKQIKISMSSKGQDNAYGERINGIIKNEYLVYRKIKSFGHLKRWTKQAVEHYNLCRINMKLQNKVSPELFEENLKEQSIDQRPKNIIYSNKNYKIKDNQSYLSDIVRSTNGAHVCPIN